MIFDEWNSRSRFDAEEKEENLDDSPMIGPLRPGGFVKGEEDDDDDDKVMVGPPRLPVVVYFHDDDDEAMVGPPCPLLATSGSQDLDDDSYDGVEKNSHRILMTNEIVLTGHFEGNSGKLVLSNYP